MSGRGLLGRWGPNHAGDPVVTRWAKHRENGPEKVLEVILINRRDTGELALPGGMVDPGLVKLQYNPIYEFIYLSFREHVSVAIKREFIEEALNFNPEGVKHIDELFKTAKSVCPIFRNFLLEFN